MTPEVDTDALAVARALLEHTAAALNDQADRLGDAFARAADLLYGCRGKVVTSGVGKSGLVAQRLAATLTSTGTPAFFLHPTEAAHGDAGILQSGDVALFVSKSGGSDELTPLTEFLRRLEIPLIAITARADSALGRAANVVLETGEVREAAPLDFVPTTSATVAQVLGDALAMALVARRGFKDQDFAFLHPGGVLGRAMRLTAGDLMHGGTALPRVSEDTPLKRVLVEILEKRLGITTVVDAQGRLAGVVTDGDLKRILLSHAETQDTLWSLGAQEIMSRHPATAPIELRIASAVRQMEEHSGGPITALIIVDEAQRPLGVLHLHDCLRAGAR
ncbi:MAG TPA: KpsF/GutQ family sugar-phosphate isomerase [Candidatus Eisenbacteria bacterium]|jgi:arabinose-5-phosphate isomerase|nr:KpsF/GutQ family sugar-phosphate isomerase [Candidatus Eisenbacteria bacterium]